MARNVRGRVVGWAGLAEGEGRIECGPDDAGSAATLADWLVENAGDSRLSVPVYHDRPLVRDALTTRGFLDDANAGAIAGLVHPARDIAVDLPDGYRIRAMDPDEDEARVQVHRRAWKPARMPYPEEILNQINSDDKSRFTERAFSVMKRMWLYDRELDLVIEAPDRSLAGCCTVWFDPETRWAEIEPLGIVPEHRRRGLATALAIEACRLVGVRGGHTLFINSAPLPHYPAPWETYLRAGFTPLDRGTHMTRVIRHPAPADRCA
ncbi:GNAT family N-acetyltransferase [Occultella gossypii]|uniref:GNAT family N-acetyltransferase n=1 Tax=Occultella gossypii TaxID=2800820 RepID=A0ABS7SEP9_9MICO|nr:GNAT family N-acetyltransferase [Occultella gossypii]MBZ2198831.1 GNAT family N-acetyltransferase [Occultella gossypii]